MPAHGIGFPFFAFFLYLYKWACVWGSGTELFWYPRLGSSLAQLLILFFLMVTSNGLILTGGLFLGIQWWKSHQENTWTVLPYPVVSRPSVFRAWRTIPISMFSASGSEEWLPKLLLAFLIFGKRKAVLNWLQAVMMWVLTLGKESWKYSPAFWFKRARCGGLCWGCFACSEQVLGGGVQKWPWWVSTVGSVCACCCAFALHFNSDLCQADWSSNFTLGNFHYGRVPPGF